MESAGTRKTFDEFWGELLLVRFHEGSEHFARYNTLREDMVFRYLFDTAAPRILDLGCGSGDLSLCLAERGAQVTAVDRIASVMEIARRKDAKQSVRFLTANLSRLSLPPESFDAILLFGLVGLMSREDDLALLRQCREWLTPGGTVLADAPVEPAATRNEWTRDFDDGVLTFCSEYDSATRIQHITPTFRTNAGERIELYDPYDKSRSGEQTGVWRYVYTPQELKAMLMSAGFQVMEGAHCSPSDHFLLAGQ